MPVGGATNGDCERATSTRREYRRKGLDTTGDVEVEAVSVSFVVGETAMERPLGPVV